MCGRSLSRMSLRPLGCALVMESVPKKPLAVAAPIAASISVMSCVADPSV